MEPKGIDQEWAPTQRYIDLAGVLFRDEAEAAEARMFGATSRTDK